MNVRKLVRRVHLWMGLTLGLLFALAGLTGSALVFYVEIDRLLHPEIAVTGPAPDLDRALETVRRTWPDKTGPWRFELDGRGGAIPARYYNPPETEGRGFAPMMVWLSPDGATVLRRDYWGEYAMTWIYDLHYRLTFGPVGAQVMGYAGIGMFLLLVTGVWAWWPRDGRFAKAVAFKRAAPRLRSLRDWHKLAGLGSGLLLAVLVVTGVMMELPRLSDKALGAVFGASPGAAATALLDTGLRRGAVGPEEALVIVERGLPQATPAWIEVRADDYKVRVRFPGDPSRRFPHSYVMVDRASGRIIAVTDVRQGSAVDRINAWLHPLHDGSAGGLRLRLLAFVLGLVPLALFVTGVWRWRLRPAR